MTTPWHVIKDKLVSDGTMTEQGVTRTPRARHCSGCGRVVIAAITDLGFEVYVEPHPTTPAGELRVLMEGRDTHAILPHGEMVWRSHHRIAHRSADDEQAHARHSCTDPPPEINAAFEKEKRRDIDDNTPIPY